MADVDPRRIGLSATIGDTKSAAEFLGAGSKHKTTVPKVEGSGQVWRLSMEHFTIMAHRLIVMILIPRNQF